MPVQTTSVADGYVTATQLRVTTAICTSVLLRLVASGLVKVQVFPGFHPYYCMDDVRKYLDTPLSKRTPGPGRRKKRKGPTT